ncbi:TetR/AcrR family transcriptional regulator [Microbacterium sp. NPDC089189]|uniref:TetR/AcrR family transcriptional regulator n=1 Tax=Microbacterium sp. NPDC089189 TaxID=3154972 RepID=UPI00341EAF8F
MATRGPYAKGRAKREEVLRAALDLVATQGYRRTTVKEIADAVGMSQTALLHYFGSKDALFAAVLERRDAELQEEFDTTPPDTDLRTAVLAGIRSDASRPGFIHLSTRVGAEAADPDHLAHEIVRDRLRGSVDATARAVEAAQRDGQVRADLPAQETATLIWALVEGLRVLWLYDRSIDMPALMGRVLDDLAAPGAGRPEAP